MKVFLRTFGCRANQYDTESVRQLLRSSGAEIVASPDEADVALFNSCAVTADAEADLRQSVRRAARANARLRSIVMGCAAARDGADGRPATIRALPTVSHVIGGADLPAIAAALDLPAASARNAAIQQSGTRALLRIQDGCDEHCTFCATTLARGANRSRPVDDLVREVEALAERHPEIVITGIHIGSYGIDIGTSLGALVERLVREVPRVRFRLSSLEATEVDGRLLELFGEPTCLAPYLHAPLQSGSDRILKRMGRHWYTARSYAEAIERIVRGRSVFGLGADLIAGFPGESEDDHARTLELIAALPFTALHVFPFSLRPGTAAERLSGRVDGTTVDRRARELRAAAVAKAEGHARARLGGVADVVVVGSDGGRHGLTEDYLTVSLADPTIPRGSRFRARLGGELPRLLATVEGDIIQ